MKYIKIQTTVSKVSDEIQDINLIKSILEAIKEKELFCSFVLETNYHVDHHSKTRIVKLFEDDFLYRSFKGKAILKDRAKYEDLLELKVELLINKAFNSKNKDNRWYLLDTDDDCIGDNKND